ncbi:MAG: RraA family protein [Gammaproteobacteria bacterium]|nr:RraA family protein [Gammaproteobacteria bacterium]
MTTIKNNNLSVALNYGTTFFCDLYPKTRILGNGIKPITTNTKMIGTAFTVKSHDNANAVLRGLEKAKQGDVLVVDSCDTKKAVAGEIFATIAKQKGLAGIIIDGNCRDPEGIERVGVPYYARSIYPAVSRNEHFGEFQQKINCGGVDIVAGDIIFADDSGIIALSEKELLELLPAVEKNHNKEITIFEQIKANQNIRNIFSWVKWEE